MRDSDGEEPEIGSPKPLAPWAGSALGIAPDADEGIRRRALLGLILEKGFAPDKSDMLAIRELAGSKVPAVNWLVIVQPLKNLATARMARLPYVSSRPSGSQHSDPFRDIRSPTRRPRRMTSLRTALACR